MRGLVSIIIVNWNGKRWLPGCFGSLAKQQHTNFEIIFVDNASTDDSVAWVKEHYPKTKIIVAKENLGFAGGNNVGYRKAKGEYVLFLNNDTRVTKSFLSELVHAIQQNPKAGGVQSKILLMDHLDTHDSVGAFLTPTGFLYHYGFGAKDQKKYDKKISLHTAKGACMMFRRDVLQKVAIAGNIFDPDYFAYFEESDLCHRVWLAGFDIQYAPASVIYHKMGATSAGMNNAFIQYHSFKNRIRTYMKNLGSRQLFLILPVHILLCEAFSLVSFLRGRFALGLAIQRAFLWNVTHMVSTLKLRNLIQRKIRKQPDEAFLPQVMRHPGFGYYLGLASGKIEE
jgi:hypothetical protein